MTASSEMPCKCLLGARDSTDWTILLLLHYNPPPPLNRGPTTVKTAGRGASPVERAINTLHGHTTRHWDNEDCLLVKCDTPKSPPWDIPR